MSAEIEELIRGSAADPQVIDLAGGLPSPAQFPRRALARAFLSALEQRAPTALQYGWPEGSPRLRELIADGLRRRGAAVDADDVLVTNGAQEALSIAVQLIAASAPRIAVDPETYPGALDAFAAHGIEAVVEPEHADARYVMPDVSNPRGTGLDAAARDRVLEGRHPIIEDDAYADLRFDGPAARPLLATALGRVWHIGTFSKTFCPGLRVGWLVPPSRHLAKARAVKHDSDLQPNGLAQAVLEQILAKEDFDAHLARLRRFYAARARRLARGVRRFLPDWRFTMPSGGFALWLEAPDDVDEVGLLRAAIDAGVSFDPGSQFRPDHASRPTALRLCFSYVEADKLAIGVERLAEAWRRFLRTG